MKKTLAYVFAAALLVALGSLAPAIRENTAEAAPASASDRQIALILEKQEKMAASIDQIKTTLAEIQAELKIIKVRATH